MRNFTLFFLPYAFRSAHAALRSVVKIVGACTPHGLKRRMDEIFIVVCGQNSGISLAQFSKVVSSSAMPLRGPFTTAPKSRLVAQLNSPGTAAETLKVLFAAGAA